MDTNPIVVNATELPKTVIVVGADGKKRPYELVPTRKCKGAQLCATKIK